MTASVPDLLSCRTLNSHDCRAQKSCSTRLSARRLLSPGTVNCHLSILPQLNSTGFLCRHLQSSRSSFCFSALLLYSLCTCLSDWELQYYCTASAPFQDRILQALLSRQLFPVQAHLFLFCSRHRSYFVPNFRRHDFRS